MGYEEALKKATVTLGEKIDGYYNGNVFAAECYLKVLCKPNEYFDNLYWIFSIVGRNGDSSNVLIDIKSGEVVLAD